MYSQQQNKKNSSFLKFIDLFGRGVNLRFQGEDKFKTACGGVATLVCFLVLFVYFLIGIFEVHKGKLDTFTYMVKNSNSEGTDFTQMIPKQTLAFAIEDPKINSSHIEIESGFYKGDKKYDSKKNGSLYPCKDLIYNRISEKIRRIMPPNLNVFCVDINSEMLKMGIQPRIKFKFCENKKKCETEKNIRKLLKNFGVWGFALADSSDFLSSQKNFESKFTGKRIQLSSEYNKKGTLVLREVNIIENKGLLGHTKRKISTHMFLTNHEQIISTFKDDPDLMILELEIDKNSFVEVEKKFKSIVNLLAFIGGLSKGIIILMLICVFPVREIIYYKKLINHMFNVCLDEKQADLALKMMSIGINEDGVNEVEIQENLKNEKLQKERREERFLKVNKIEKFMRKSKKRMTETGLIGEVLTSSMNSELFFKNMMNAVQGEKGFENFSDLLMAGMGKKKEKKKSLIKSGCGMLPNGKFKNLGKIEKKILGSEFVSLRLKQWVLRTKTRVFMKKKRSFDEDKQKLSKEIKKEKKNLLIKQLTSVNPSRTRNNLRVNSKLDKGALDDEEKGNSRNFLCAKYGSKNKLESEKDSFIEGKYEGNDFFDDKNPISEFYKKHFIHEIEPGSGSESNRVNPSKNLNFQTHESIKNITEKKGPSNTGGGGKKNKKTRKKLKSENSTSPGPETENKKNDGRVETERGLLKEEEDDDISHSIRDNRGFFNDNFNGFVKGVKNIFGMSKSENMLNKQQKTIIDKGFEKIENLKNRNKLMYNNKDKLQFYNSLFDYFRFWVSPIWKTYSRRILYTQVTIFPNFFLFQKKI